MTNERTDGLCTECLIHQKCRCNEEQAISDNKSLLSVEKSMMDAIATDIHYPGCWCTTAYPTIFDAIREYAAAHGCNPNDCQHR